MKNEILAGGEHAPGSLRAVRKIREDRDGERTGKTKERLELREAVAGIVDDHGELSVGVLSSRR
jgi:hypothetical protein